METAITALISSIRSHGIKVQLQGQDLRIYPGEQPVPPDLLGEIRQHKAALVAYFSNLKPGSTSLHLPEAPLQQWYDASHTQMRMWYTSHSAANSYNIPITYIIEGVVDVAACKRAFAGLVERHESLRTVFAVMNGALKQKILSAESCAFEMELVDLREKVHRRTIAQEMVAEEYRKPFDLGTAVCRGKLVRIEEEVFLVLFTVQHICTDGWSNTILLDEAMKLYEAYRNGRENPLPAVKIQYKDYCAWLQKQLSGERLSELRSYWHRKLQGPLPQHRLACYHHRPAVKTYNGASHSFKYDKAFSHHLRQLSRSNNVTLFITCVAILKLMFYKYTGQTDIIFGTISAGRNHPDAESCVGLFLDALALRTVFLEQDTFEQLLLRVRDTTLAAYEHQLYPFDMLVNELVQDRVPGRMPVYDIFVLMQNFEDAFLPASTGRSSTDHHYFQYVVEHKSCTLDLEFFFSEEDEQLCLNLNYNTDLFLKKQAYQLGMHFEQLCRHLFINRQQRIVDINVHAGQEPSFSSVPLQHFSGDSLSALFREQAVLRPAATALLSGAETISYSLLQQRVDRTVALLHEHCPAPEGKTILLDIPLCTQLVTALLAVTEVAAIGAITDQWGEADAGKLQAAVQPALVLTTNATVGKWDRLTVKVINLDSLGEQPYARGKGPGGQFKGTIDYYTCTENGVLRAGSIQEEELLYYLQWAQSAYSPDRCATRMLLYPVSSLNIILTSVWIPLCLGQEIQIGRLENCGELESNSCWAKIQPDQIALWENVSGDNANLVVAAGALTTTAIERLRNLPGMSVGYEYMPDPHRISGIGGIWTEAHVWKTRGKPLYPAEAYVLDSNGRSCFSGAIGKLYLRGGTWSGNDGTMLDTGHEAVCHVNGEIEILPLPADIAGACMPILQTEVEGPANALSLSGQQMEALLLEIWRTVLNHGDIAVNDSFFRVGGHSLKLIELAEHIARKTGVQVPLGVFFQEPSIRLMAGWIINAMEKQQDIVHH